MVVFDRPIGSKERKRMMVRSFLILLSSSASAGLVRDEAETFHCRPAAAATIEINVVSDREKKSEKRDTRDLVAASDSFTASSCSS